MSDSSRRIVIEFTEDLVRGIGSAIAFTIIGKRLNHYGGTLIDDPYTVTAIGVYGIGKRSIFIDINPLTRFNNAVGEITVNYNSSKGGIMGLGGPVQSFSMGFTPTDLIPIGNPWDREYLKGGISNLNAVLILINEKSGYENEYLKGNVVEYKYCIYKSRNRRSIVKKKGEIYYESGIERIYTQ